MTVPWSGGWLALTMRAKGNRGFAMYQRTGDSWVRPDFQRGLVSWGWTFGVSLCLLLAVVMPAAAILGAPGDADCSGEVDDADVPVLISRLFGSGGVCPYADANVDDRVSVPDITRLLDILVGGRTPTPTVTQTAPPSLTPTEGTPATATETPSVTATSTQVATVTQVATATPTLSPTPSASATVSATGTRTPTGAATASVTRTPSATASPSRTRTATKTGTATATSSPSRTGTGGTPVATPTRTRTVIPTTTSTRTATSTRTPSSTLTPTGTRSATPTFTLTKTRTSTRTATMTPSATSTRTPSVTRTPTWTRTATGTPTITATRTVTRTPTVTPSLPIGPVVNYFGIASADNHVVDATDATLDGIPIFDWGNGFGFIIVVEGRPGSSKKAVGTFGTSESPASGSVRADLQIEANRMLGNGSGAVCDVGPPPALGGVPAVNPFNWGPSQTVTDALNDFACRFDTHLTSPTACTFDKLENYAFIVKGTTMQFCSVPSVGAELRFPSGETELTVQLRDVGGNLGNQTSIIIRVP